MKIVIDIPDTEYQRLIAQDGMSHTDAEIVVNAFYNGAPLPKGHGDLIDRDTLECDSEYAPYYDEYVAVSKSQIMSAPVIIKADKEET